MSNLDILRRKVKFHIKDIAILDNELDDLILLVLNDIAKETKLFKKLCGFTVEQDKNVYDFRDITRLNEEVEKELENVYVGYIPDIAIKAMLLGRDEWPKPITIKKTFEEEAQSKYLSAINVFDSNVRSVFDKFKFTSTALYIVEDNEWLEDHDGEEMILLYAIMPDINELLEEDLMLLDHVIIEGCKYYLANTLQSADDNQVSNLYYQRFWQKKKELIDMYPQHTFFKQSETKDKKWL